MMRASTLLLVLTAGSPATAADWPAWRGAQGIGVSSETDLPLTWSATEHVRWRVPLPEAGNSTPIVSRGRVFITQAVGERRTLMCFDRTDGKPLWERGVATEEKEPTHATNSYCSASPVTDGERVIASFASDGLYCYDFRGKELWRRADLGRQIHIWGGGASPVIYDDLCFLNFGPGETTCLLAVDKKTGGNVWRNDEPSDYGKPESPEGADAGNSEQAAKKVTFVGTWTTPTVMQVEGQDQLLMSWPGRLAAYDPRTGDERWSCSGLNPLVYTSPIYADGIVVTMGGYNGMSMAVRAGGMGDMTESRRLWHHARTAQRIGSGVIKDGYVFVHNDPGTAECFELETGKRVWRERLAGSAENGQNWSSAMLAGDYCYTMNQGGDCFVFKASPEFELVAVNTLCERSNSSIVPSDGELFIRTHEALWCIGEDK